MALNLTHITKKLFPDAIHEPSTINYGHCYNWAFAAYLYYKDKKTVSLWSDLESYHAFIKIDQKFYDAESPKGVYDQLDLQCYVRAHWNRDRFIFDKMDEIYFRHYWGRRGRCGFMPYDTFVKALKLRISSPSDTM
jgi:hypothetical protein